MTIPDGTDPIWPDCAVELLQRLPADRSLLLASEHMIPMLGDTLAFCENEWLVIQSGSLLDVTERGRRLIAEHIDRHCRCFLCASLALARTAILDMAPGQRRKALRELTKGAV